MMHEWKQTCEFVDQETTSLALTKVESLCHFIRLDAMKKAMNGQCEVFGINLGTLLGRKHTTIVFQALLIWALLMGVSVGVVCK